MSGIWGSRRREDPNLHFGLLIVAVGVCGIIAPVGLVRVAERSATSSVFYLVATVRVAFGLVLISVASSSRTPRTLRVLAHIILIVGITTALTGLVAIEGAHAMIESWLRQGSGVIRFTGIPLLALGGFVAYACAPTRRAARRGMPSSFFRNVLLDESMRD